jgi:hypothetical protein
MSIRDEIISRVKEGRLFEIEPFVPGERSRVIFACKNVRDIVFGPWEFSDDEIRFGKLRADLDHFSSGGFVVVSTGRHNICFMKHLSPKRDEVWEIRSRAPRPSIRVFGSFATVDVFIATNWGYREDLGGVCDRNWRDALVRCKSNWRNLFPSYNPVSGEKIDDYISKNVVDEREF